MISSLTVNYAVADLTLYCENYSNRGWKTFGGLEEYRECLLNCQCFVFELMCLEKNTDGSAGYTMTSRNRDYARSCENCYCNDNELSWAKAIRVAAVLDTPRIPIAPYSVMMLATMDGSYPNQATEIISYIGSNRKRLEPLVENYDLRHRPGFHTSYEIDSAGECSTMVTCDLYYDIDWNYRLSIDMTCE